MCARLPAFVCVVATFGWCGSARAFSDADVFAQPALTGGGEGRYFTGSRTDPYSCSVCHSGGTAPEVTVTGLPDRIEPGERSEVTIRWKGPDTSHALQLELATEDGTHAELALTALDRLPRQQRCEQLEEGDPAVYAIDLEQRRVLGVSDCGASELRFSFTPKDDEELYFSLGVVRSDGSGTPDGDGVLEVRRRIGARAANDAGGCSVVVARRTPTAGAFAFALACLWAVSRRRRARRRYALAVGFACLASGCYQPSREAGERPRGDEDVPFAGEFEEILNAARGDAGAGCASGRPRAGNVVFRVRTISGDGRYRPRNVGAIWIAQADGTWVKTLERWGARRAKWLTVFNEASGGDVTDAITGPTLPMHKVHEVTWNRTDRGNCEVEDGAYQVHLEMTDWSGTGPSIAIPFELSDETITRMPEDMRPFLEMELRVE